jgi:hypothetical protein
MLKVRLIVALLGLPIVAISVRPLVASPRASSICCASTSDCYQGEDCVDPGSTGTTDCDPSAPGYCQ